MCCTPSSCTSSLCTLLPCTAPLAAGLALAPALPHCSRARPNRVRSWPASCLAYTARILLARYHAPAPAPPPAAPARVTAPPTLTRALAPEPPVRRLPRAPHLRRAHVPTPSLLAPRPLRRCRTPTPSRAAAARVPAPLARAALAAPELRPPAVALGSPQHACAAPEPSRAAAWWRRGREKEKKHLDGAAAGGEKKRGTRIRESRGERQMEFPKDLCAISENCRGLSVKYNFSLI
jgi:hypothetical protein